MLRPKKIHTKKMPAVRKFSNPPPPPYNFSNGPSLKQSSVPSCNFCAINLMTYEKTNIGLLQGGRGHLIQVAALYR